MAYSSVAIAGDELAAFSLDRPCLVGSHIMRDEFDPDTTGNVWTTIGETTSADETETGFFTWRAWDGFAHETLYTRPDAANTIWYYTLAPGGLADFDTICLWGENLDAAITVQLQIANSADFATDFLVIYAAFGATRLVSLFGLRYSGVEFARLRIVSGGGGLIPRLNELWIGRRRQLLHHVNLPWDNKHQRSEVYAPLSAVGVSPPRTIRRGGALRNATIVTGSAAEHAEISSWHSDTIQNTRSFLWIDTPSSDPQVNLMALADSQGPYRSRQLGPNKREILIGMRELDPFLGQSF